jgi:hypothetical protein
MKSMKKVGLLILMAVMGASLAIVRAHAEDSRVVVDVPFDFVVGNSLLKAGSYKVEVMQSGVLDFWSAEAQQHHYTLIVAGSPFTSQNGDPYLVFTRYGSEAFLNKVAMSVDNSYEVPVSNREKELIGSLAVGERGSMLVQPAH